jgi:protein subunit release factor A
MFVVEIRPGEGGDDAVAFADDLADAFSAHARRHGCTAAVRPGRTFTVTISGRHATRLRLDDLTGTHRIQRIPKNDRAGRRHTSTATVAVLDAATPTTADLSWEDVDVDVYSGSGPGGQHRNKTEQCARLTHRATGLVVVATAQRSQRQNLNAAFAELRRRLSATAADAADADRNKARRGQIATGQRPTKQWTWNDQRREVVDHSTGNRYPMAAFLRGRFDLRRR